MTKLAKIQIPKTLIPFWKSIGHYVRGPVFPPKEIVRNPKNCPKEIVRIQVQIYV